MLFCGNGIYFSWEKFARRQRHREKNVHRISFFSNRELETRLETRKNDDLEILTPPPIIGLSFSQKYH